MQMTRKKLALWWVAGVLVAALAGFLAGAWYADRELDDYSLGRSVWLVTEVQEPLEDLEARVDELERQLRYRGD